MLIALALSISLTVLPAATTHMSPAQAQTTAAFTPLTPARLLDTRQGGSTIDGVSAGAGAAAPEATIELQVAGRGGIPTSGIAAVVLNVTAVDPNGSGYTTVYPTGSPLPNASNLNWSSGQVIPNAVIVKVGAGGKVSIYNSGATTNYIVDVSGWIAADAGYVALDPARLVDTRVGGTTIDGANAASGALAPNTSLEVQVAGRGGVAATGATSVVLNVTAVQPSGGGYTTVYPTGEPLPNASNLNWSTGDVIANSVTVKLGTGGKVTIFNSGGVTNYIVDVVGYFQAAAGFTPLSPARLMDTRVGSSTVDGLYRGLGRSFPGEAFALPIAGRGGVPATGVGAVVLNITAVAPSRPGFTTTYPTGEPLPNASQLNFRSGQTIPNLVVAKLGRGGAVTLFNSGSFGADFGSTGTGSFTNYIVDVVGWFAGSFPAGPVYAPNTSALALAPGQLHSCFVVTGGVVRCTGENSFGQLGNGTTLGIAYPIPVTGITGATQVGTGDGHSCALLGDGTVRCWGRAADGRLGNGTTTGIATTPQAVSGISGATALGVGKDHACVILADTTVRCWGRNNSGELGNNTTTSSATPVVVDGLTGAQQISAGVGFPGAGATTCTVVSGSVKCWGFAMLGMNVSGNGPVTSPTTVQTTGGNFTQVSVGADHACARRSDGTVQCWGLNRLGQLGDGTTTNHGPADVAGLTGVASISAGDEATCALFTAGSVSCWGDNGLGIINAPLATRNVLVPTPIPSLSGITALALKLTTPCVITANGAARCWGYGATGATGTLGKFLYFVPATVFSMSGTAAAVPAGAPIPAEVVESTDPT